MEDFSYGGFSGTWRKEKEARVQGFGAGKQQGAGQDGGKVLLLVALLIAPGSHWWRGCDRVYLAVLRPFQAAEIM